MTMELLSLIMYKLECEERCHRLKRENQDEGPKQVVPPIKNDPMFHARVSRSQGRGKLPPQYVEDISTLSGKIIEKIIECSLDPETQCWVCMRIRMDKETPNDINTYRKVLRSIKDNITEEVVLNEIEEIVQLPMYADRISKAQQMQHSHSGQHRR